MNSENDPIQQRIDQNKDELIMMLKKTPIVQLACEKIGISRATFYRWKKSDPSFEEQADTAIYVGKHLVNDMAESQLIRAIKEGNMTSIIFWLKNNHPGYKTRVELSGTVKSQATLTEEQEEQIQKALHHAGLNLQIPSFNPQNNGTTKKLKRSRKKSGNKT
jgi:hypothetical protein